MRLSLGGKIGAAPKIITSLNLLARLPVRRRQHCLRLVTPMEQRSQVLELKYMRELICRPRSLIQNTAELDNTILQQWKRQARDSHRIIPSIVPFCRYDTTCLCAGQNDCSHHNPDFGEVAIDNLSHIFGS